MHNLHGYDSHYIKKKLVTTKIFPIILSQMRATSELDGCYIKGINTFLRNHFIKKLQSLSENNFIYD